MHEHIKDVCRRLAKAGYLAIAPELYARQGDVSKMTDFKQIFAEVVSKVPDAQVMSDLDAAVAWAGKSSNGDVQRVGSHRLLLGRAHRLALRGAQPGAEGRCRVVRPARPAKPTPLQPKYPIDVAADLKAPVLGLYGGQDQGIPLADVEKMRAALAAAKDPSKIIVFPGRAARLQRRLPAELSRRGRRRPRGANASRGSASTASADWLLELPEHADVDGTSGNQCRRSASISIVPSGPVRELEIRATRIAAIECVRDLGMHRDRAATQQPLAADPRVHGGEVRVAAGIARADCHVRGGVVEPAAA